MVALRMSGYRAPNRKNRGLCGPDSLPKVQCIGTTAQDKVVRSEVRRTFLEQEFSRGTCYGLKIRCHHSLVLFNDDPLIQTFLSLAHHR